MSVFVVCVCLPNLVPHLVFRGTFGTKFGDADSDTYAGEDSVMNAPGLCISAEGQPA